MMNPLQARNRTLAELLVELRARTGFVHQGTAASNNDALMKSFLQEAHDYVYGELLPASGVRFTEVALEQGSYLYDWHNDDDDEDIEPAFARALRIVDGSDVFELVQRMDGAMLKQDVGQQRPTHYGTINGQIALWPVPDRGYKLQIEYLAGKPRFAQPDDRTGVPDRLVLLYALANAKAHFGRPDSQSVAATFNNMLFREKVKQHENKRYFHHSVTQEAAGQTVHVGGDGVYRLG